MSSPSKRSILTGLLLIVVAVAALLPPSPPIDFEDGAPPRARLHLAVDDKKEVAEVTLPPLSASSRYVLLEDGRKTVLPPGVRHYRWPLEGDGTELNHPNRLRVYIVDANQTRGLGEVEVLKQSEEALFKRFHFVHKDGYVLIGRTDFTLEGPHRAPRASLADSTQTYDNLDRAECERTRAWFPELRTLQPATGPDEVLRNATAILSAMYRIMPPTGPTNLLDGTEPPSKTLDMIVNHGAALQCTGIRDLFIGIALCTGVIPSASIRKVDAWRYAEIDNVIVNGHSFLELRAGTAQWFVFDPLLRAVFTDRSGRLLSAADIRLQARQGRLADITVRWLPLQSRYPPYSREPLDDRDPSVYNYWCHFNLLKYTHVARPGAR